MVDVTEDYPLLDGAISGESSWGEIRSHVAAEALVFLPKHVDEVVISEQLPAERMANEHESVWSDVGEDFMGKFGISDEDNKSAEKIVGAEAITGGHC